MIQRCGLQTSKKRQEQVRNGQNEVETQFPAVHQEKCNEREYTRKKCLLCSHQQKEPLHHFHALRFLKYLGFTTNNPNDSQPSLVVLAWWAPCARRIPRE